MNKYGKLVSNSIIFAIGNLTVKVAQFFILPLLTKYLIESQYGLTENVVSTLQDLLMPLLTLGLAEALFRFSVGKDHSLEEIFTNSFLVILIGIAIFTVLDLIFYGISYKLGNEYGQSFMLLLIPLFAFKCIKNIYAEFIRGAGKTITYALSSIIESAVLFIVAYILIVYAKIGIYGYIIALIAAPIVGIIFVGITNNPFKYFKLSSFNKDKLKVMLRYSIPNVSNSICWWIVQTSSRYLIVYLSVFTIGGFTQNNELTQQAWAVAGIYTAASKLPSLINVVSSIFLQAWSLSSSQEVNSEDKETFYSNVFRYYLPVVMLATTLLFLVLPFVSGWLLKGNYYDGWVYSPMLIMGAVSGCFSAFFGAFFGAHYKSKYSMISTFIGAGANLIICFVGIPIVAKYVSMENTVYVAAFAFWMSYNVIVFTRIIFTKKLVKLKINYFKYIFQYVLNSILAMVYTLNWKYCFIVADIVLVVLVAINMNDILEVARKTFSLLKQKFGRKKDEENTVL